MLKLCPFRVQSYYCDSINTRATDNAIVYSHPSNNRFSRFAYIQINYNNTSYSIKKFNGHEAAFPTYLYCIHLMVCMCVSAAEYFKEGRQQVQERYSTHSYDSVSLMIFVFSSFVAFLYNQLKVSLFLPIFFGR